MADAGEETDGRAFDAKTHSLSSILKQIRG
jgi:hypothetical protein